MDLLDQNKLLLFIFFVIPGIVALKTYEGFYGRPKNDLPDEIMNAVFLSCLNYAVCGFPLLYFLINYDLNFWQLLFLGLFVLLVLPCALCVAWIKFVNWRHLRNGNGKTLERSPWEYFFKKHNTDNKWLWTEIELIDGTRIHGVFGHATSYPDPPQIYLQKYYYLDSEGKEFINDDDDLGIIILTSEIKYVNFKSLNQGTT
ncbi:DUF6338 family protein [Acinetobacter bohemicus]|uniref:DUF6338 family protein n=1 Tax=Acinetobacter bohemicus TaxID=1435036 RepID=UPI0040435509